MTTFVRSTLPATVCCLYIFHKKIPPKKFLPLHLHMCMLCCIAMPKEVNKAKIACLNFSLQKMKLPLGIMVVVQDPDQLQGIRDRWVLIRTHTVCLWWALFGIGEH